MRLSIISLCVATLAVAAPVRPDITVRLESAGNTIVKATIANVGKSDLRVRKSGSLLDDAPIKKVNVFFKGRRIDFDGMYINFITELEPMSNLDFIWIPSGEEVSTTFDITEVHDLSLDGTYNVQSAGVLSVADADSKSRPSSVDYESNALSIKVDGSEAANIRRTVYKARSHVTETCLGGRLSVAKAVHKNAAKLARAGQKAALSGSAKRMEEYFKSSTDQTREAVAAVFSRAAEECDSTDAGISRFYCTDVKTQCSRTGPGAYVVKSESLMVMCDLFFVWLPPETDTRRRPSQASVFLHELTHLRQIGNTEDFEAYEYSGVVQRTAEENLRHADTYMLFAQAAKQDE